MSSELRDLHVAFLLLRFRSGKTAAQVASEAEVAETAVFKAERPGTGRGGRPSVSTVDALLTYYGADLVLVSRLIHKARKHLGDLRRLRAIRDLPAEAAQRIWQEVESEDPPIFVS